MDGIAELLGLWSDRARHSTDVKRLALEHVERLRGKIRELEAIVSTLETLADCCAGDDRPDCPILQDLETTPDGPSPRSGPPIFGRP